MNELSSSFAPTPVINLERTPAGSTLTGLIDRGAATPLVTRIIGVGGAGSNAIAQMGLTDLRALRLVLLHTSARMLETSVVPEKILLGSKLTHGLGAGGDPSLARSVAEKELPMLRRLCEGVDLLFIVTGLGGGTGTGVAPVLARIGRESGALTIGVATLPFELEGPRRRRQAQEGIAEFKAAADAVICLPNQKLLQLIDEKTSVLDGLKITNGHITQGIRGLWQMFTQPGLMPVNFSQLRQLLRDRHAASSFATVQSRAGNRVREIVDRLCECPFLDGAHLLDKAEMVVANLSGGPDLTIDQVESVMEEINRRTNHAPLLMGASLSDALTGCVELTLMVGHPLKEESTGSPVRGLEPARRVRPAYPLSPRGAVPGQAETARWDSSAIPTPPPSNLSDATAGSDAAPSPSLRSAARRLQQGNLPLEMVPKGRFEKTAPTLYRGEDLDIPTYVRRGVPLN